MYKVIKSIFTAKPEAVVYESVEDTRMRLTHLANELEANSIIAKDNGSSGHESVVAAAIRIREVLSRERPSLTNTERIEITKVLNRAKVRTFMSGTDEGYRAFRILDTVSEDVRKYL